MADIFIREKQIEELVKTIQHLKTQNEKSPLFTSEIKKLEQKLEALRKEVYSHLTSWDRVQICRHPKRPKSIDYITALFDNFFELKGDRAFGDDHACIGGIAELGGKAVMVIGQEKGNDTESRIFRNFGMMNPEGFRKARRLMKLAEKFKIPVITFIDTPGANPVLEAEERGQGLQIAVNLQEMARLKTPVIVAIIGEGCSGGALGMGIGDLILMLEHSYYSVISPEGCASILYKDASKKVQSAEALKLTSQDLLSRGIIDAIINEPLGGAHLDPVKTMNHLKQVLLDEIGPLTNLSPEFLIERRYQKFRSMGNL